MRLGCTVSLHFRKWFDMEKAFKSTIAKIFAAIRDWSVVRLLVAAILLFAACLKAYQISTAPTLGDGWLHSRWFNILVVDVEVFYSFWLISGFLPQFSRLVCVWLFSVFAAVSFFNAISGETSCGCFGWLEVNPWITTVLDTLVIFLLIRSRLVREKNNGVFKLLIVLGCWTVVATFMTFTMLNYEFQTLGDDGLIRGNGNEVVLEPEQWYNHSLPIQGYLKESEFLTKGVWLILLYDHRCPACRECVKTYTELAMKFSGKSNYPKILFVEVPPFENASAIQDKNNLVEYRRLDGTHKWKVNTPVLFFVDEGVVKKVINNPRETELIRSIWGGEND
jgi:hypothetical protein